MKITNRMTRTLLGGGLGLVLGLALAGQAAAQSWTELFPTGSPPVVRTFASAVLNPTTNRMIVFGGQNGNGLVGVVPKLNDVFVLQNADGLGGTPNWTQLFPTGAPPSGRGEQSAVYDEANNKMIVFAGNPNISFCFGTVNDTWVLSNADGLGGTPNWTQLSPIGRPPTKRGSHSAVYDPATNRMVVFGGNDACRAADNQVWVLTHANGQGGTPVWTQLFPTGDVIPVSSGHIAGYDPATNRMIVFSGGLGTDVYVLENANGLGGTPNWIRLIPTGGPPSTVNGRGGYSPTTNKLIAFGGSLAGFASNEVWVLDNADGLGGTPNWTQLSPPGPPPERFVHTAVLNVGTNRMTIFGGSTNIQPPFIPGSSTAGAFNDTWVLDGLGGSAVEDQLAVLETAIDDAIASGDLVGSGSGKSANGRLGAFVNMIAEAGDLIVAGSIEDACGQLRSALRKVDGSPRPPDFASGEDAELIADQIVFLRDLLECD